MNRENKNIETITGFYCYIENPCTTDPCLPGMACAVKVKEKYYYLTVNDLWFSENRSWAKYIPKLNDLVTVDGFVREKQDIFGNPFRTIEIVSLKLNE